MYWLPNCIGLSCICVQLKLQREIFGFKSAETVVCFMSSLAECAHSRGLRLGRWFDVWYA